MHEAYQQNRRSSTLGSGTFLTAFAPYCSPAAISSFDHGGRIPTTRGAGGGYLIVECGYRGRESPEGTLKYRACFLFRQRHPRNIGVRLLLLFFIGRLQTETHLGRDDQLDTLRRTWLSCAEVCTALNREEVGRP